MKIIVVLSEFLGVYVLRSARLFLQLSISGLVVISAVKCFFLFIFLGFVGLCKEVDFGLKLVFVEIIFCGFFICARI